MTCVIAGCDRAAAGRRQMCRAHYERQRKFGDAFPEVPVGKCPRSVVRQAETLRLAKTGQKRCSKCTHIQSIANFGGGSTRKTYDGLHCWCNDCRREDSRKYKYGLPFGTCSEMLLKQGGKCPVCAGAIDLKTGVVDHDHRTGEVRGFLCNTCNSMLGMLEKRGVLLSAVARYLEAGAWRTSKEESASA